MTEKQTKPPREEDQSPHVEQPEHLALSVPADPPDPDRPSATQEVSDDTPSGAALKAVGEPSGDPTSEAERARGLKYRFEKAKKRWLS